MQKGTTNQKVSTNPVTKIRGLIQNLDAQLMELSTKYTVKPLPVEKPIPALAPTAPIPYCHASNKTEMQMRSNIYCSQAVDAYRTKRIFIVYGNYYTIRRELMLRGWKEKLPSNRLARLQLLPEDSLMQCARPGNDYEIAVLSKIMNNFPAFFVWQPKFMRDINSDVLPYRNRVRRNALLDFSTKIGLIGCCENEVWFQTENIRMRHPRFYRMGGTSEERKAFIEDYRRTQCRSLIRYLWKDVQTLNLNIDEENGVIPAYIITFAVDCIKKELNELEHADLDVTDTESSTETDAAEWKNFIEKSNSIMKRKGNIKMSLADISECVKTGMEYIEKIEKKQPDYDWDGTRNLWILKPGYQCRGIGIVIKKNIDDILQFSNRRYIVQKYIERPLLIYNTKFDIRLYMLQTITDHVVSIWIYQDCYLKFSSQIFSLDDLREVIHLTNNTVQKKYLVDVNRDKRLPNCNMWSSEQFKSYLQGLPVTEEIWNNKIFPGFIENIIPIVLASFENTQFTQNSFEVYGCDFMLDQKFNPVLIEINATPDFTHSTEVTANLCPRMQKDLIKVVVDLPSNPNASTGLYNLIYKKSYKIPLLSADLRLKIVGAPMPLPRKPYKPGARRTPVCAPSTTKNIVKNKEPEEDKQNYIYYRNFKTYTINEKGVAVETKFNLKNLTKRNQKK